MLLCVVLKLGPVWDPADPELKQDRIEEKT
jgi:hypothetical protein